MFPAPPNIGKAVITNCLSFLRKVSIVNASSGVSTDNIIVSIRTIVENIATLCENNMRELEIIIEEQKNKEENILIEQLKQVLSR